MEGTTEIRNETVETVNYEETPVANADEIVVLTPVEPSPVAPEEVPEAVHTEEDDDAVVAEAFAELPELGLGEIDPAFYEAAWDAAVADADELVAVAEAALKEAKAFRAATRRKATKYTNEAASAGFDEERDARMFIGYGKVSGLRRELGSLYGIFAGIGSRVAFYRERL